ncbi:MAG: helix-turn-helix domain-containing protein [Pseudomonadota bacterium]
MEKTLTQGTEDGRRQRSERSRQAIIDAMLSLMTEGILVPTAQQIAERAGVGIRSVFRHFPDMESLFAMADQRIRSQHSELFSGGDREGTFEERLQHAVERHAMAYEMIGNLFLGTKAMLWRHQILRDQYLRTQRELRKDLDRWLPELLDLSTQEREMVDAVASFETWNRLREFQRLSKTNSIQLITDLLRRILAHEP